MATNIFLKLHNIKGEATDPDLSGWIEVESWSWGASNSGTTHIGEGRGEGKVSVQDITISKKVDLATAAIWYHLCRGKVIPEGQLTVRAKSANGRSVDVLVLSMTNVLVTGVSNASGDQPGLTETVTLNFRRFAMTYASPRGTAGNTVEYDIAEGPGSATLS